MKSTENYLSEIKEIRKMMEQSSRFLSLSGLSGVLIGVYALVGSLAIYRVIYYAELHFLTNIFWGYRLLSVFAIAILVFILSIITTLIMTWRRSGRTKKSMWNAGSRLMLINLAIPLISGGLFILVFVFKGLYEIAAPASLIFYGLALINAAKFTRQEVFYLGIMQIILGILASLFHEIGIIMCALGFGVLHIIYGTLMYFRYELPSK